MQKNNRCQTFKQNHQKRNQNENPCAIQGAGNDKKNHPTALKRTSQEEKYQGIRPAPGYPACPDHTEKYKLFDLLDATANTGIILTESLAMYPGSSVCGWYFAHPQSQYFGIGKITKDQVEDYAKRKGMPVEMAEKWLSPVID